MIYTPDMHRVCAESYCDLRTVRRAYEGKPVTAASRARITRAAEYLKLPPPPEPTARSVGG